jgi:hypothetical protein
MTADKECSYGLKVGRGLRSPAIERAACNKILHMFSDLDGLFGATENGHEIWNLKCQKSVNSISRE